MAPGLLQSGLAKLSLMPSELALLYLQLENNRLAGATARSTIEAYGKIVAAEHKANHDLLEKAIAAAGHKSWWQKFLTVFKVISIAATVATGGTVGVIAGALMVTAMIIEKRHPDVALGLNLAAVGLLVGDAASKLVARSVNAAALAASSRDAYKAGAAYVAAGAGVGAAVGRGMVATHAATELRCGANRLLAQLMLEEAQEGQREEIATLRALSDDDCRQTRAFLQLGERRHASAAAAIRA